VGGSQSSARAPAVSKLYATSQPLTTHLPPRPSLTARPPPPPLSPPNTHHAAARRRMNHVATRPPQAHHETPRSRSTPSLDRAVMAAQFGNYMGRCHSISPRRAVGVLTGFSKRPSLGNCCPASIRADSPADYSGVSKLPASATHVLDPRLQILATLIPGIFAAKHCLDVGCNAGSVSIQLCKCRKDTPATFCNRL
jgi:hypothetical protein